MAYDTILHSCQQPHRKVFFLNEPAGTRKTFCYSALCHCLLGEGKIILHIAFPGISATLLKGGRIAPSDFMIPINIFGKFYLWHQEEFKIGRSDVVSFTFYTG